jgi:hypothetical protein
MIELYVREYARLESERASLNSRNPSDESLRCSLLSRPASLRGDTSDCCPLGLAEA